MVFRAVVALMSDLRNNEYFPMNTPGGALRGVASTYSAKQGHVDTNPRGSVPETPRRPEFRPPSRIFAEKNTGCAAAFSSAASERDFGVLGDPCLQVGQELEFSLQRSTQAGRREGRMMFCRKV